MTIYSVGCLRRGYLSTTPYSHLAQGRSASGPSGVPTMPTAGGQAMKRLQTAAEKGDANAQFNLGVLYDNRLDDNGHPIGSNRAQALKWLQMAAEQGMA